jgi:hypothetical protein
MSTHTPGPWEREWRWSGFDIVADGPPIAHIHFGHDMKSATANSHLIAAAPDLLAACRAFIAADPAEGYSAAEYSALKLMHAAIAKAEGKGQAA